MSERVQMSFDMEAHLYPSEYIDLLEKVESYPRTARDSHGKPFVQYTPAIAGMSFKTIERLTEPMSVRLKLMDRLDVQAQLLSTAIPGAEVGTANESVNVARRCNNHIHEIVKENKGRFYGLATLPMIDLKESVNELERVMTDLEFSGVEFQPTVRGKPLDSPEYWEIYEKMQELGANMRLHPAPPRSLREELIKDYSLWGPSFGFTVDAALATLRLIYSGMIERFPKIKIMILHLGETLPYLFNRLDRGFKISQNKTEFKIRKLPHEYLRDIYVDTSGVQSPASLVCAATVLGPNNLVFGSDYPFEDFETEVTFVRDSSLQSSQKKSIMVDNCRRYLGI